MTVETARALCVVCGEQRPHAPLAVCRRCARGALDTLVELPLLYEALLTPSRVPQPRGGRASGGSRPEPLAVAALRARGQLSATVSVWAGWIAAERQVMPPRPATDVAQCVRMIIRHLAWALSGDEAGTLARDLDRLLKLRRIAYPARRAAVVVACPTVLDDSGATCGHRVPVDPDADEVVCPRCGRGGVISWWRQQLAPGERVDAVELSDWLLVTHGLIVPVETIRTMRKRGQLAAVRDGRRWMFDRVEAAAVLTRSAQIKRVPNA